jgi:hypothetical protein
MQGMPDQLDETDYLTVPRSEWRALLEEVATMRRLVAELAARLPAVDDLGQDDDGRTHDPADSAGRDPPPGPSTSPALAPPGAGLPLREGVAPGAEPGKVPAKVALRPTVVRRDELGRSIRAYEVPLQSARPPARRSSLAGRDGDPVAGSRTPTLDALRTRIEQAAAAEAANTRRSSRLARWSARLSGR